MASAFFKSPVCQWISYSTTSEKIDKEIKKVSRRKHSSSCLIPILCTNSWKKPLQIPPESHTVPPTKVSSVLETYITKAHSCCIIGWQSREYRFALLWHYSQKIRATGCCLGHRISSVLSPSIQGRKFLFK